MVLAALVLVQHAHDAALPAGGQLQQFLHHLLRQYPVVDVVHQVAYTIHDHQVRPVPDYRLPQQRPPLPPVHAAHVEDVQPTPDPSRAGGEIGCHLHNPIPQYILRRFIALLRIVPHHPQRCVSSPHQHTPSSWRGLGGGYPLRHQHTRHIRLAALRLTRYRHQLAPWEARLAEQPEQELHLRQFLLRRYPQLLKQQHLRAQHGLLARMLQLSIQLSQ